MECTEDKNSKIQKIKGLHSALHINNLLFVLGKNATVECPLKKFIKEDCLWVYLVVLVDQMAKAVAAK